MHTSFTQLMQKQIFPALALKHTYIEVPEDEQKNYANGHDQPNALIRVNSGPLAEPAYGVKSTIPDMLKFVNANLKPQQFNQPIQATILETHQGYYKLDDMTQALGWEKFNYPASLNTMQASNADQIGFDVNLVQKAKSNQNPSIYHKTGSTNGFGTYVVFIPSEQVGIVMLMNKTYPILNLSRQLMKL